MLNKALLDPEVSRFLQENLKTDLPTLILKGSPFENITGQELAIQIKGLQIAEKKFPELFRHNNILYPPKLNLEQTSSETTAKYKAKLVQGKHGIDLTGGLGIDTYYLSKHFEKFIYCELNNNLAQIAQHNFNSLKAENITVKFGDGLRVLQHTRELDWVFADPARRNDHGGKVFKFSDCEPNIPENLDLIFRHTKRLLVKSSPILDISAGIEELKYVAEIHIVAVRNEVKELLWVLEKNHTKEPIIKTINFDKNGNQIFSNESTKKGFQVAFNLPQNYLYEPNAAIMKSGLFEILACETNTKKLHLHSHLYTSVELIDFPGRKFIINKILEYKPSNLKEYFKSKKANITTRNFPESVEKIRKKFKVKDGGSDYIFFTTNLHDEKIVIFCEKVS